MATPKATLDHIVLIERCFNGKRTQVHREDRIDETVLIKIATYVPKALTADGSWTMAKADGSAQSVGGYATTYRVFSTIELPQFISIPEEYLLAQ